MYVAHIAIYAKNLEESIAFYELFGAKEIDRAQIPLKQGSKLLVHLDLNGMVLELISPSNPLMVKGEEGAISHFCICVEDIQKTFEFLKEKGVTTFEEEAPSKAGVLGVYQKIFLKGPSGESIELIQKR